nr:vacuolar membrane-associated protein iml1 [Quercus suber]
MAPGDLSQPCTIVLHDDRVSTDDVLCGINVLQIGGVGLLTAGQASTLCICPSAVTRDADEVSIHVTLAQRFGFENRTKGTVRIVEDIEATTATHVEIFFREQHLSRADMWRLMRRLDCTVMYRGQNLNYLGKEAAKVEAIYFLGKEVESSYVTCARTKPIFRSGSARFTILIQLSKAMLEYWSGGDLMYERLLFGFLPELFRRWEVLKVRHQVQVVFFGRTIKDGRSEDFFDVVAANVSSTHWHDLLRNLAKVLHSFRHSNQVSIAAKGNMVEAIHMAAMDFATEDVDPNLSTTGSSILAITANTGMFETSYDLLKSTTDLLLGNSIGVDIIALSPKPSHPVPLFIYEHYGVTEYALPHWVDVSYWETGSAEFETQWLLPDTPGDTNDIAIPLLEYSDEFPKHQDVETWMSKYDDVLFEDSSRISPLFGKTVKFTDNLVPGSVETLKDVSTAKDIPHGFSGPQHGELHTADYRHSPKAIEILDQRPTTNRVHSQKLTHSARKISLGPKGLAPGRSLATTTLSSETAQLGKDLVPLGGFRPNEASSGLAKQIRASLARKSSEQSLVSQISADRSQVSRPIDIHSTDGQEAGDGDPASALERAVAQEAVETAVRDAATGRSETPKARQYAFFGAVSVAVEADSRGAISPWVTLLNPCNPKRENMRVAAQYRKWQHVFPREISSGAFKWASMCSPATLPLTTEYRPSPRELERYATRIRRIMVPPATANNEIPASTLLQHLVALRLSHGFQMSTAEYKKMLPEHEGRILMSLGSLHHELQCLSAAEIQIIEYTSIHDPDRPDTADEKSSKSYTPLLRSVAAETPKKAVINLTTVSHSEIDWQVLDDHVVSHDPSAENEGMSRMRFVLIPVDPPRAGHATQANTRDLSDEERRIDGIQRLTQLWQRHRYLTEEVQRHQASVARLKAPTNIRDRDPNPLAIEYQTRDPSAVVNAYGPTLTGQLAADDEGLAPLFASSEMYHSSTFDVGKLVKQMQAEPPHGVEVRDRRWFTRLHFKCFRGDEMVNWLLRVFKDVHTREEAVVIGNELMDRGIFGHVRHKHNFRDGNYFYQITSTHRTTEYPDTASMFNKNAMRSVPSTPMSESLRSPMMRPFQVSDSDSSGKDSTPIMAPLDKKQILLSQTMQCNVDPSRKSDQLEVVNLHYDRIHNPENCYHIQLDWTDATANLIRDAVARWTALTESHGLKLVQLPLTEACKTHIQHPFDEPVAVALSLRPPDKVPATPQLNSHSSTPQLSEDPLAYQKSLLRKLDFVLDYEAAASFTTKLEVSYSWGRPEYELTQFVHKSGLVIAQIAADKMGDFLLLPNRLVTQRAAAVPARTSVDCGPTVDGIISEFVAYCRNKHKLQAFYEDVNRPRVAHMSPFSPLALMNDSDVPPMTLPPHLMHRTLLKGL